MVDFILCERRVVTVAILATLFVAVRVNGEGGCVYDFEQGTPASDFDLECNGLKNAWNLESVVKNGLSSKAFVLDADQEGCMKTMLPIALNSTSRIVLDLGRDGLKDDDKFAVRLLPVDGSCAEEECVWIPKGNLEPGSEAWVTLEHRFPIKSTKDYHIQLEVGKRKNKFVLDSISIPNGKCHGSGELLDHTISYARFVNQRDDATTAAAAGAATTAAGGGKAPEKKTTAAAAGSSAAATTTAKSTTNSTTTKSGAPGLNEISKNLMLTSASVLILNHFLN